MRTILLLAGWLHTMSIAAATDYITNVYGRQYQSLNGKWEVIVDPYDRGIKKKYYENKKARGKTDFYEYGFEGGTRFDVPGDWNSQMPELKYYEGTVWYGTHLLSPRRMEYRQRFYLVFTGVSNRCTVYLNGKEVGGHEGAFTGFQIEVTDQLKEGDNFLVVQVNNRRTVDAIPAMTFDWWNYGGITRDVLLVSVPQVFVSEYQIQLDRHLPDLIHACVQLSEPTVRTVTLSIPELKKTLLLTTNDEGVAQVCIPVKRLQRWSPQAPKLYDVQLVLDGDTIRDQIGFRNIETRDTEVLLNGEPIFLKSISFHEEIPQGGGRRAFSEGDARYLVGEAKTLGCNMVRLAHYQQNEHIVREAERQGLMVWQEIPVWQSIDFANEATLEKAKAMLHETIRRDYNRCADCFWSVANETTQSAARNHFLKELLKTGRENDTTRLYCAAFNTVVQDAETGVFTLDDEMVGELDVIGINRYMGWYSKWKFRPEECTWRVASEKPLFISEFGGEAVYGQHGSADVASSWSEEYQEQLYRDNLTMFACIPNLCGISPWLLFDFRSPTRLHPFHQEGWNRKGLISNQGQRKRAWQVMHDFYGNCLLEYRR